MRRAATAPAALLLSTALLLSACDSSEPIPDPTGESAPTAPSTTASPAVALDAATAEQLVIARYDAVHGLPPTPPDEVDVDSAGEGVVAPGSTEAERVAGALNQAIELGVLPISAFGQGTRRLTALGLQLVNEGTASVLLIDEIEHALEPFRLRHLVRTLRARVDAADASAKQVLCTTHSNIAVEQFEADELHVVRRDAQSGRVTISAVPDGLQGHVRKHAEAFLARRIIVCEGSTEVGIVVELDDPLEGVTKAAFANHGAVVVPGGGSSAPAVAKRFRNLGFETALIVDSDRPLSPTPESLRSVGVHVLQWKGKVAIEDRLALDLPGTTLATLVDTLATEVGDHIIKELAEELDLDTANDGWSVVGWREGGLIPEDRLRAGVRAAARTAKGEARWFKSTRAGIAAGRAVRASWDEIGGTELRQGLGELLTWATA